ncbi:mRNA-decapping enzyme subunit 2 [Entomophthora muscae]|uniref:mRNA-decapping enzyme subunit 2 n=1 Tax=Entomophthora muscae TaxID=34485 RepID=A0ACC2UI50_9FUNG|nr:mRNA-decapping enzyme subunit 2 [Entomophthora muscae]
MSFTRATFNEVLDDLSCRFLINIPEEEGISAERIGFQIEEAHWFYEDFVREQNSSLPGLTLKAFSNRMFQHCPLLHKWSHDHEKYYNDFLTYKLLVPVCGAIILNPTLDKCLFVRGYNSKASWGFPKGKVDLEEDDHFCAIREIKEEVGFDIEPYLVKKDCISQNLKGQRVRLYIVPCIPESVSFQTQTRKEIGVSLVLIRFLILVNREYAGYLYRFSQNTLPSSPVLSLAIRRYLSSTMSISLFRKFNLHSL